MSALAIGQLQLVEHSHGLGNRQVDVLGDRASLDAHGAALRLQPLAPAGRAGAQRAVRLEVLLLEPRAFLVPSAEVRNQPFEAGAKRILRLAFLGLLARAVRLARRAAAPGAPKNSDVAQLLRQPPERQRQIDPERPAQRRQALRARASGRPSPTARSRRPAATATRRARAAPDRSRTPRRDPGTPGRRRAAS